MRSEPENVRNKYNYTCQPETLVYFITYKNICLLINININSVSDTHLCSVIIKSRLLVDGILE